MRKISLCIACFFLFQIGQAQQGSVYYYYNSEKIYLKKDTETKIVCFKHTVIEAQKESLTKQLKSSESEVTKITPFLYKISGNAKLLNQKSIF